MVSTLEIYLVNLFAETFWYPYVVVECLLFWSLEVIPSMCLSDMERGSVGMNFPKYQVLMVARHPLSKLHHASCILLYMSQPSSEILSMYIEKKKTKKSKQLYRGLSQTTLQCPASRENSWFSKCYYLKIEIFKSVRAEETLIYYGLSTYPEDKIWFCGCSSAEIP